MSFKTIIRFPFLLVVAVLVSLVVLVFRKSALWQLVESDDWLVRVLHDQIFAVLLLPQDVNDDSNHTPSVIHVQGNLGGELVRFELLHTQYHVFVRRSRINSRNESEFHMINTSKQSTNGPLGQLATVVLDFGSENSARLRVQLHPPVHTIVMFGVPLVESLDVQELLVVVGSSGDGVDLRSDDELDVVADVPLAVLVGDRGNFAFVAFDERVLVFESVAIFVHSKDLLREVVIDVGRLERKIVWRVDVLRVVFLWWVR